MNLRSRLEQAALFGCCKITGNHAIPLDPELYRTRVLGGPLNGMFFSMPRLERAAFALGTYERHIVETMARTIRRGSVAYDVGANAGYLSLVLSRLVGPEGRVFAFEPDPKNLKALAANIHLNRISNVTVVGQAISDRSGTVAFASFDYSLVGHIARDDSPEDAVMIEVECSSLDDFVFEQRQPQPDFIKIDVEGAEDQVIRGAARVLRAVQPVILAEVRAAVWPEISELMQQADYTHQMIEGGWRMEKDELGDVLFLPSVPNSEA